MGEGVLRRRDNVVDDVAYSPRSATDLQNTEFVRGCVLGTDCVAHRGDDIKYIIDGFNHLISGVANHLVLARGIHVGEMASQECARAPGICTTEVREGGVQSGGIGDLGGVGTICLGCSVHGRGALREGSVPIEGGEEGRAAGRDTSWNQWALALETQENDQFTIQQDQVRAKN